MNKKILYSVAFLSLFCLAFFVSADTAVRIPDPLAIGDSENGFGTLLTRIATGVSSVLGALSTIAIIVAAALYLTSAGNPEKINKAKAAILYAIIGLAIALAAGLIANIIIDILRGSP